VVLGRKRKEHRAPIPRNVFSAKRDDAAPRINRGGEELKASGAKNSNVERVAASAIRRNTRTLDSYGVLVRSPRAAAADEKVFEDIFAVATLQGSAATPTGDGPVEIDVVAFDTYEFVMRLDRWGSQKGRLNV
jgi:hypothetical protein